MCNIAASVSKMEALSHQLCQLDKDKLRHCQGESIHACVSAILTVRNLLITVLIRFKATLFSHFWRLNNYVEVVVSHI